MDIRDRFRGAIWGQFVGDAAALGAHWIYNLSELQRSYPSGIQGFEPPLEGHYHYGKNPGDQTHYGEAALILLESVAELRRFDPCDFGERFVAYFGSPNYQGYRDKATRETLENYALSREVNPREPFDFQQGADDDQLAGPSRIAPVVVAHFKDENLLAVVETATRVCQNNERAVGYVKAQALILRELLQGRDVHGAIHRTEEMVGQVVQGLLKSEIVKKTRQAMDATLKKVVDATLEFGQSCPLGSSFPSSIQAFAKNPDSYPETILATIRAGGDSAGRASMSGAWLGAHLGVEEIPVEWRDKLSARERIEQAVEKLLSAS